MFRPSEHRQHAKSRRERIRRPGCSQRVHCSNHSCQPGWVESHSQSIVPTSATPSTTSANPAPSRATRPSALPFLLARATGRDTLRTGRGRAAARVGGEPGRCARCSSGAAGLSGRTAEATGPTLPAASAEEQKGQVEYARVMGRRQRGQTQRITSLRCLMPDRRQLWQRAESAPPDCTHRVGEVPVGTFAFRRRFSQGWNPSLPGALRRGAHQRKKWCGRWDSNPQAFRHRPLKTACLPVPPLPHADPLYPSQTGPTPVREPALPPVELRSVQCLPPPALLPLFPAPRSATQPKSAAARHKQPTPAKRP